MHELSVAERVLRTVVSEAEARSAVKVTAVRLRLGDLQMITQETLQETFNELAADSIAQGAELRVQPVPGHDVIVDEIEVETA